MRPQGRSQVSPSALARSGADLTGTRIIFAWCRLYVVMGTEPFGFFLSMHKMGGKLHRLTVERRIVPGAGRQIGPTMLVYLFWGG